MLQRGHSGMGCFSVLYRLRAFSLALAYRFMNCCDIYDASCFVCSVYERLLRIYAFTTVIKTCLPPADRSIAACVS